MAALRGKALIAYLLVCVFWGSTYLAIRVGVGELPPFLFAGLRFLTAGVILFGGALAFGDRAPRRAVDWRTLAIVGLFLLAGGNAFVVWAEQYTPSGVASIFVVTVALWMAFFDAIIPGGSGDLNWRVVTGLVLGFLGSTLLIGASPREILHADLRGPIALTSASAFWSLGSVYAKRHPTETSPYMGAAVQMIAGGIAVTLFGTLLGEWRAWHLSPRGAGAIAYLVVFGSIVGYSAYAYALRHASATAVGTYAYVNPVIAVLLGGLLLKEPIGARTVVAMGLILGAVVWIQLSHKLGRTVGQSDSRTVGPDSAYRPTVRQSDCPTLHDCSCLARRDARRGRRRLRRVPRAHRGRGMSGHAREPRRAGAAAGRRRPRAVRLPLLLGELGRDSDVRGRRHGSRPLLSRGQGLPAAAGTARGAL